MIPYRSRAAHRQRGVVLFIALMAMVVMTMAALTLMRTSGTTGTIAGNLSFQQATTQATDAGVELAFQTLTSLANPDADVTNQYFAFAQNVDAAGVPVVAWNRLPCYNALDPARATIACSDESAYRIQYVIDRQCSTPFVSPQASCLIEAQTDDGSRAAGHTRFQTSPAMLYRVSVRALGPRGTASIVQAILAF